MKNKKAVFKNNPLLSCSHMKKSPSDDDEKNQPKVDIFGGSDNGFFDQMPNFSFKNSEILKGLSNFTTLEDNLFWSMNLCANQSTISAMIDYQSSICVDNPTSAFNPKGGNNLGVGASSGSSDEDGLEIDGGSCGNGTNPMDIKRTKRMVSNRESARRSRSRKQAHLTDLEKQVDQLQGENAALFKQLTDATHQFKDASTNHRVLKSDVEALRAKVKLAEDMVVRGSLTSSLSHLLQNYLTTPQEYVNNNMNLLGSVSPVMAARRDDDSQYTGITTDNSIIGLGNGDNLNSNVYSGVSSGGINRMTGIWP